MNTIKGKVIVKNETIKVSEKFSKRTFVIQEPGDYPQFIEIELQQDKCGLMDSLRLGSEVEVFFNLKGRLWVSPQGENKYFNTVVGWKIDILSGAALQSTSEKLSAVVERAEIAAEQGYDLPF